MPNPARNLKNFHKKNNELAYKNIFNFALLSISLTSVLFYYNTSQINVTPLLCVINLNLANKKSTI